MNHKIRVKNRHLHHHHHDDSYKAQRRVGIFITDFHKLSVIRFNFVVFPNIKRNNFSKDDLDLYKQTVVGVKLNKINFKYCRKFWFLDLVDKVPH